MVINAGAAAAAAAAAARRRQEEEESMTGYSTEDLAGDWEFKILRAVTRQFHDPDKLRKALAEEAQAGWILVEKFDDQRLRLKRPMSAREHDHELSIDPYRTTYGMNETTLAIIVIFCVLTIPLMIGLVIALTR
jgi:hypothetical protein